MKKLFYALPLLASLLLVACGGESEKEKDSIMDGNEKTEETSADDQNEEKAENLKAINLWPSAGLFEEPGQKKKWKSSVAFGAILEVLETKEADDRTYAKVKAVNGDEGWVNTYLIAENAYRAAATSEISLYKDADILAIADKKIPFGEIVAVSNEKVGDFVEVVSAKRGMKGYAKADKHLSTSDTDLVVAMLRKNALEKEGEERTKAVMEILNNSDYSESIFYKDLENKFSTEEAVDDFVEDQIDAIEGEADEVLEDL